MFEVAGLASIESSMRAAWISCASSSNLTAPSGMSAVSGSSSIAATWAAATAGSMCSLVVMLAPRCRGTVLPAIRGARCKLLAETTADHHLLRVLQPLEDTRSATVARHPYYNKPAGNPHLTKLCVLLRRGESAVLCASRQPKHRMQPERPAHHAILQAGTQHATLAPCRHLRRATCDPHAWLQAPTCRPDW